MNVEAQGILRQLATATVFPAFLMRRLLTEGHDQNDGASVMKVSDIMTTTVRTCLADEAVSTAVQIMWDCDCGIVPVVDAQNRVVGTITDRDICVACWSRDARPGELRIGDVMTSDVQCCSPYNTLAEAEDAIRRCQVRRLPVVDAGGRLVGILALADIARAADGHVGAADQREIRAEQVIEAIAAVCQPHLPSAPTMATARHVPAAARGGEQQTRTSQQRPVE